MENGKKKYRISLSVILVVVVAFFAYNFLNNRPACALLSEKYIPKASEKTMTPVINSPSVAPIDKSKIIIIDYPPTSTKNGLRSTKPIIIPKTPVTMGTPTTTKPTTTPITMKWGAYAGDHLGDLEKLETLVGKKADIQSFFVGWNDNFPTAIANNLKGSNRTLLIFWEQYGVTLDSINEGKSDVYIKNFAAAAKAYGGPIILAPMHEMNGNWDPWGGYDSNDKQINPPAKIINVWKRIHQAFKDVPNVKFAWDVNNVSVPNIAGNAIGVYYPGNEYVDYVGVDGFNFGDPWQSPAQVFDSAIKQLLIYKKPIYIFSTAAIADSRKAAWIKDFGAQIKKYNLAGWVWFNQDGSDGNWLINSDTASLQAFKAILSP